MGRPTNFTPINHKSILYYQLSKQFSLYNRSSSAEFMQFNLFLWILCFCTFFIYNHIITYPLLNRLFSSQWFMKRRLAQYSLGKYISKAKIPKHMASRGKMYWNGCEFITWQSTLKIIWLSFFKDSQEMLKWQFFIIMVNLQTILLEMSPPPQVIIKFHKFHLSETTVMAAGGPAIMANSQL